MSSGNENKQEHGQQQQQSQGGDDDGHSGEGAASALAHMKSQSRNQRHNPGDNDKNTHAAQ
jgi:hypothetical protein